MKTFKLISMQHYENEKSIIVRTAKTTEEYERRIKRLIDKLKV